MSNQWNKVLWDICKLRCKLAGLGYKRACLKMLHGNFPGHLAFLVLWGGVFNCENSVQLCRIASFHSLQQEKKNALDFLLSKPLTSSNTFIDLNLTKITSLSGPCIITV